MRFSTTSSSNWLASRWQTFVLVLAVAALAACSGNAAQNESTQEETAQESAVQEEEAAAASDVVIGDEDSPFNGVVLEGDNPAMPVAAQNEKGGTFEMSNLRGEYVLVNFGYTFCPDICPLTLGTLANAYTDLSEAQ